MDLGQSPRLPDSQQQQQQLGGSGPPLSEMTDRNPPPPFTLGYGGEQPRRSSYGNPQGFGGGGGGGGQPHFEGAGAPNVRPPPVSEVGGSAFRGGHAFARSESWGHHQQQDSFSPGIGAGMMHHAGGPEPPRAGPMQYSQSQGRSPRLQGQISAPPGTQQLSEQQQGALAALQQQQQQPGGLSFGGSGGPPQQQPPSSEGSHPGMIRELRVEDALLYLDDVKREFRNQPGVYNEFLTIMKNFKTQAVDTPGVIQRVSKLFRGYNQLILGFNTFLPEGYKISLADLQRQERERQIEEEQERQRQQEIQRQQLGHPQDDQNHKEQIESAPAAAAAAVQLQLPPAATAAAAAVVKPLPEQAPSPPKGGPAGGGSPKRGSQQAPTRPKPRHSHQKKRAAPEAPQPDTSSAPPAPAAAPEGQKKRTYEPPPVQSHPAVEFDHAISYVTQIKRRFANDPNTYHSFLEILHTYQKEQRGIKEVLEQVAHLFQDHPDLLKEFTFFLPDAVQEQAKERLHRAAAESESRLAMQRQAQLDEYNKTVQQSQPVAAGPASQQELPDTANRKVGQEGPAIGMPPVAPPSAAIRKRPLEGQPLPKTEQQPETFIYNSAVERQFFDLAKEAMSSFSRDGGQTWAEFMKCMDLYAQDVLSKAELLTFVEPLLGKRNVKLFHEFKRILAAAGSTGSATPLEDAWYSVPLSEIDFSRCRRCTVSYRALPRDYPAPPCTERSDLEQKVLNDVWVSLPVGSEESYTFRHMRRNNYEEQLFRCEDERYEIDMVIDCNAATLQRLMPYAEEIARLSKSEVGMDELGLKNPNEGAGVAGKRFQYTFDKSVLGVIHRNIISRIYGDAGQEMLDLMVKNPVVAIPLVVGRLRQKDKEWKKVRDRLRVDWRKIADVNYYKSLDHRSLTWRTIDKRATSTRTLVSDIKDRAHNRGKEGKEALRQKLDKAKEEHGVFFEVTMANNLTHDLDLTFLPKPDRLLFTPHLSLLYENNSWAQRDAYRILVFALERGTINPHDKERCHRLWTEFLGPWFGLTPAWMHAPAVAYQESPRKISGSDAVAPPAVISEEEEDSMDEDMNVEGRVITEEMNPSKSTDLNKDSNNHGIKDYHPIPSGSRVSTIYGEGIVKEFRRTDRIYTVELSYGTAYLRPSNVLCSLTPADKSGYTDQLRSEDRSRLGRPTDQLAIGNQSLFLVFRLHQILVRRLNIAMSLAQTVGQDKSLCTMVEQLPGLSPQAAARRRYDAYLSLVYAVLDGGHVGEYEDLLRSLLGHRAYELATMDKLISNIWKNLQAVAQDDTMWSLIQLYRRHKDAGSFQPESFRQEAAFLSEAEPMYAFQWCPIMDTDQGVMHFEYLGIIAEDEGSGEALDVDDGEEEAESHVTTEASSNKRQRR